MRVARVIAGALAASIVLSLPAASAWAGGNWIEWKRRYNVTGKVIVARNVFYARSEAKVTQAGPYFAYVSPETYGWRLPKIGTRGTIRLGRLKVIWPGADSQFKGPLRFNPRARIRFTVPDLPSGDYLIAFCNRGCTRTLGDADPTGGFHIVNSALEGQLSRRLDVLGARFREYRSRAQRAQARIEREVAEGISDLRGDAVGAQRRVDTLERRVSNQGQREESIPWTALALAGLVSVLATMAVGRLRRPKREQKVLERDLRRLLQEEASRPPRPVSRS